MKKLLYFYPTTMAVAFTSAVCPNDGSQEQAGRIMMVLRVSAHAQVLVDHLRAHPDYQLSPDLVKKLVPMAVLLKIAMPDVQQKLNEFIFAAENPNLTVNKHQHGADLKDKRDNSSVEHKVSVVTKTKPRCNFNWPIPKGATEQERRANLLESIRTKTKGGKAVLQVKNGLDTELTSFHFQCEFLMEYFSRITLGESNNHNMGCTRCGDCGDFHRLRALADLQQKPPALRTEAHWKAALAERPAHCGIYKAASK
jgi:hypothetical protein